MGIFLQIHPSVAAGQQQLLLSAANEQQKNAEQILKNEELAPKLLDKIKSQGVREMDDSAMIMRVKYKTAPGEQFVIRKEVYRLMQEAFAEEGIEFAHRNVTVYIPPESSQSVSGQKSAFA